ncbi:MAG: hypothetical protein AAF702_47730 [Chloroflexota bacterium]
MVVRLTTALFVALILSLDFYPQPIVAAGPFASSQLTGLGLAPSDVQVEYDYSQNNHITIRSVTNTIPDNVQFTNPQATLQVLTANPNTAQTIRLQASGVWRNGCVPEYTDFTVQDYGYIEIIAIAERADQMCTQSETEWSFQVDLEISTPYEYQISLFVDSEQEEERYWIESLWLNVAGAIHLTPPSPEPDEEVTVLVDGWHNDGCVPAYVSSQTEESIIVVEAATPDANTPCGQAMSPWSFELALGVIDESVRTIEVYITYHSGPTPSRVLYQSAQLNSIRFRRGCQNCQIYLPIMR